MMLIKEETKMKKVRIVIFVICTIMFNVLITNNGIDITDGTFWLIQLLFIGLLAMSMIIVAGICRIENNHDTLHYKKLLEAFHDSIKLCDMYEKILDKFASELGCEECPARDRCHLRDHAAFPTDVMICDCKKMMKRYLGH